MEITALCKVVDNYGDIGVVFRMISQLKKENPDVVFNLVIDDLMSFSKICNQVQPKVNYQFVYDINVYSWNCYNFCYEIFRENDGEKLSIILECFQCGRPDWMEKILFEDKLNRTVNIIMIDYLTAEDYAESFHCLSSLTRSKKVQKVNFMPGFTAKTGGLIIDDCWKKLPVYQQNGPFLVFTYERDWNPLVEAIDEYKNINKSDKKIYVAKGRGQQSFLEAAKKSCFYNNYVAMEFINQNEWDEFMKSCSILIIRGEESMSRACLSGIPFIWHAYPQSDEYQLVKVNALLEKLKVYFSESEFNIIKNAWIGINSPEIQCNSKKLKNDFFEFFKNSEKLSEGYRNFALNLRKNGDLCTNLMTFIKKFTIIK